MISVLALGHILYGPHHCSSPALATLHVTSWLRQFLDSCARTIAVLTANQGVATKGLGFTDNALRLYGMRRADAFPRHFITQTGPTVTSCKGKEVAEFIVEEPRHNTKPQGCQVTKTDAGELALCPSP